MTIKRILESKGSNVITLHPDVTLADVAKVLSEKRIGAIVLVEENGTVAGIVSERDIVRVVGANGPESLRRVVRDVMTLKVTTCTERTTVDEALQTMTSGRFRHLPVLSDGRLAGLVSIGDVVKRKIEDAEAEAEEMRGYIAAG
ncbi:XdhC and CoxI family protein [Fulvimarina manganoxydans]|uniref:XdhC and CoxI family protein n=1 Tax=Fulvimarina manganoxydans TaxID=937218 RepID=A0A1W1ZWT4_9HYPH|nr:CBS domain-containing protein [Fulvimarina manganoxydans]MCK5930833.1 CBS domain-containing protein [Fulvimarina manganoxydans]MEE2952090.1 CBS domain-containing protein [Pseudomonadota bacterium]SMC52702.1 XdhC and CoxI family protein [Fulvimarina manganoxydans]